MISQEKHVDILTLHRRGFSVNGIARMLNLNWRTVKKYLQSSGIPHRYDTSNRKSQLEAYYGIIEQWLSEDQYTASRIFDRLKPLGYAGGYDQVRRLVRKVKGDLGKKAYIRFETEPGKQAQVDFGDFKIKDREGKTVQTVYLFAMILGYSRKLYVELIPRRTMKEFLDCHIRAFAFFGGVPQEILYDRMKNVFIRQMTGAVEWNKLFYSFCIHYQFKPLIAPAYGPWVKGKVEKPMDFVRESFFRGYSYSTLEQANRDLFAWAVRKEKRIHGTTKERIDHRFLREKPYLGLCPHAVFDTRERHYRKVYKDCTISFGANRYVVPHSYVGKEVTCKTGEGRISIIHNEKTLVTYTIPKGKGHLIQDKRFYAALRRDALQNARKYAFHGRKKKGQATLGITTVNKGASIIVPTRSISEYSDLAGGTTWSH